MSKIVDAFVGKVKVDTKELCLNFTEGKIMYLKKKLNSGLLYVPKVMKEEVKSSNLQENTSRRLTLLIR